LITVGSAVRFIHRASFQGGWIRDFAKEESADQARPQARKGYHNYSNRFFKKKKGRNYRLSKNFLRNKKYVTKLEEEPSKPCVSGADRVK
ncbi:hypothetical protein, partial [Clostridium baratii]|uniref:hypothetical protein n=1 Tax=Clostridium baratii TaxID=1561 RepID=UPI001A9A6803